MANPFKRIVRDSYNAPGGILGKGQGGFINDFLDRYTGYSPLGANQTPNGVSNYTNTRDSSNTITPQNAAAYEAARQRTRTVAGTPEVSPRNNVIDTAQPLSTAPSPGTTAAGARVATAAPVQPQSLGFFMGKEYFDPSELYKDQLAYLDSVYGTNLSTLRKGKKVQLDKFRDQQKEGLSDIANYYSGLGDIYQSSQGVREAELAGDVDAIAAGTQKPENALFRAIRDFMESYNQSEEELARNYQGSRDAIGSNVVNDINERLAIRNNPLDFSSSELSANNALLSRLQDVQRSRFNNPFAQNEGRLPVNPILQNLAGISA